MDRTTLQFYTKEIIELSEEDISLLISGTRTLQLKKGDVLLKEGDVCREFYLVEKGYLRNYYTKEDGSVINLNFTFEGNFTSNLKSYRSRQPSESIIEAGEDTSVWIFDFRLLSNQLTDHPDIARFVRRLAINLLLASAEHSNMFKIYTPTERYRFIEKNNPQLLQRVSLSQIASYLGVTRETLSRIRSKNN